MPENDLSDTDSFEALDEHEALDHLTEETDNDSDNGNFDQIDLSDTDSFEALDDPLDENEVLDRLTRVFDEETKDDSIIDNVT